MSLIFQSLKYSFAHGSKAWFKNHVNDQFVKKAIELNYRSRAAFKLQQIQQKYKILGNKIIDLGSSPGSWSQYCLRYKNHKNNKNTSQQIKLVAVDILEMQKMQGIDFYKCDARDKNLHKMLLQKYGYFDTIISDMAPNFSGINFQTHQQIIQLNKMCVKLCLELSHQNCNLVMKTIEGSNSKLFFEFLQILFQKAYRVKPKASRSQSKQFFFVCKHIKKQYYGNYGQQKQVSKSKNIDKAIQQQPHSQHKQKIQRNSLNNKRQKNVKVRNFINNQLSQLLYNSKKANKKQIKRVFDEVMNLNSH